MGKAEGRHHALHSSTESDFGAGGAELRTLMESLREATGDELRAVIFFGSRLVGTSPDAHSAADLVLVVGNYAEIYRRLRARGILRRSPRLLALLNRLLPPNIFHYTPQGPGTAGGKCFVVSERDLRHALSPRARDHFFRGRLSQRVSIVYAATPGLRLSLEELLTAARRHALQWVPLFLRSPFGADDFCLRMLELSYRAEIRPETADRAREVFLAQRASLIELFAPLLQEACAEGLLTPEGNGFRRSVPAGWWAHQRWRWFFRRSRVRATLRWFKYMLTFEDWLEYIVHKVERRTGLHLELSDAERRWPLILLWPKAMRVLRALGRQRAARMDGQGVEDVHGS